MPERVHTKFGEEVPDVGMSQFADKLNKEDIPAAQAGDSLPTKGKRDAEGKPKSHSHMAFQTTTDTSKVGDEGQPVFRANVSTSVKNDVKKQKLNKTAHPSSFYDLEERIASTSPSTMFHRGTGTGQDASSTQTEPRVSLSSAVSKREKPQRPGTPPRIGSQATHVSPKKGLTNGIRTSQLLGNLRKQNGNGHTSPNTKQRPPQAILDRRRDSLRIKTRTNLPIWVWQADIRWKLRHSDILLLVGETGSGKSTQLPQFLIREPWFAAKQAVVKDAEGKDKLIKIGGRIAITEPRRVAVTSLAHRVASETGSYLGPNWNQSDIVGYSVRFETCLPSATKIKFMTEGTLLQELLRDPYLTKYSAVVIDEIHERGVDVDLVAGFLKNIVKGDKKGRGGLPLKLIVMSATANIQGLKKFFSDDHIIQAPNATTESVPPALNGDHSDSTHTMEERRLSNASTTTWEGFDSDDDEQDPKGLPNGPLPLKLAIEDSIRDSVPKEDEPPQSQASQVEILHIEGRQHPVEVFYAPAPINDYQLASLKTVFKIHLSEPLPGDILVFLPGMEEIEALQRQVLQMAKKLTPNVPKIEVLTLYGQQTLEQQQKAFAPAKEKNTRKVVIATNIAETSITVAGVRHVIDCGKAKVKEYRHNVGMSSLLARQISQSSAIQRKGRAGRESPGKCYRLYTEQQYLAAPKSELPEILRTELVAAVLTMKSRGIDDVWDFPLMDPPPRDQMVKAFFQLMELGALSGTGDLTATGTTMAQLPMSPFHARVLISAAENDVLLEAIDIISCLSNSDEIFVQPKSEEEREATFDARRQVTRREGDLLTILTVMQRATTESGISLKQFCSRTSLNLRSIQGSLRTREQLRKTCKNLKLIDELPQEAVKGEFVPTSPETAEVLLKCFLRSFHGRVAFLGQDGKYKIHKSRNEVTIHPSSSLFGKKAESIMFLDHSYTNKSYAKCVSAIQANWVEVALEASEKCFT